ncbi:MAG: hypothetical protein ACE5G8_17935, partial [Anaerolineae bacterium]
MAHPRLAHIVVAALLPALALSACGQKQSGARAAETAPTLRADVITFATQAPNTPAPATATATPLPSPVPVTP